MFISADREAALDADWSERVAVGAGAVCGDERWIELPALRTHPLRIVRGRDSERKHVAAAIIYDH